MKVIGKFLIDYETLFMNHELLTGFHDCLLMVPFSSFVIFHDMVREGMESDFYNEQEKETFLAFYKPFIDVIVGNHQIIDEMQEGNKKKSSMICLSTEDNLYLCFTGSFENSDLKFSDETLKDLDVFDFDVLNACVSFNCPLFSTRKKLEQIIEQDELNIELVIPVFQSPDDDEEDN